MHFNDKLDAFDKKFTTVNPFQPSERVVLIMDFRHNIKKVRNNIFSSGDHKLSKRKIKLNGNFVVWIHWINAYNWDVYVNRHHSRQRQKQKNKKKKSTLNIDTCSKVYRCNKHE